jgi:uncharacterized protein YbjT (DUF2867 family)
VAVANGGRAVRVLVTGGTGVLGRELVARLRERAEVRVLSRSESPGTVRGDLATGEGLAAALSGVEAVAHCATAADYLRPDRDVAQTRRLLAAARDGTHIVYISIVGVDRIRFGYYRAKLACERLIQQSGLPWTILRTTQFHDLALLFLMLLSRWPVALVPRGFRGQPVDTGEVADRMAELVLGEPAGRVPDLGGPRVEEAERMVRLYLALTGRRRPVLRVPVPGRIGAGFRAGHHLVAGGGRLGTRTFDDYLRARIGPDGTVAPPYELRLRRR